MMQSGLSPLFRILLMVVSCGTVSFFLRQIRKTKVQIRDVVFWILFSGVLIILSIFPQILSVLSTFLGIQSPANLLFLVIIFLLLVHQFSLTIRLSATESKLNELGRKYALEKMRGEKQEIGEKNI